jgi:S-formylglutathione hydrolase
MASELIEGVVDARATGTSVEYRVLIPAARRAGERLPLILHLHGAMSSAASLAHARSAYERAWELGELPPAVVACASTPTLGGFYIDHTGGPAWETFVGVEFPAFLERRFDLSGRRAAVGFSMGGYGALKLALRRPDAWVAVAALCPVVFPAESAAAVPAENQPAVLGDLNRAMGADDPTYMRNSVYGLLRANHATIRHAGTRIYVDCGTADEFRLHDGAEYLHEVMCGLAVPHVFKSIAGAGHADAHALARQADALRFLGDSLATRTRAT